MSTSIKFSLKGVLWSGTLLLLTATTGCITGKSDEQGLAPVEAEIQAAAVAESAELAAHKAGVAQFRKGEYGLAERAFRDAVEKNPAATKSWLGLAASYDRLQRFDLADKAYGKALKLDPHNAVAWNNFGFSHLLRGDLANAGRALKRALELDGDDPKIQHNVDLLYAARRDPKRKAG